MNAYATATERARTKVAAKATKILRDTCSIISPNAVETRDSGGEPTYADETIATDVPCEYAGTVAVERVVGDASTVVVATKLQLPYTATTVLTGSDDRITVNARGTTPQRTFDVIRPLPDSGGIWLFVAAVLKG